MRDTLFWCTEKGGAPAERVRTVRSTAEDRSEGEAERAPRVGKRKGSPQRRAKDIHMD